MPILRGLLAMLIAPLLCAIPASSWAGVFISVGFAPPALPSYMQPQCPQPGWMWTPGYWAYGVDGYFWVPGTWVAAPYVGALWTPGYWGWSGGFFVWHAGYWGTHVGYYGGVNYGFGYMGIGFAGGVWHGGVFAYNTAVMHVNTTIIHNTYVDNTIVRNNTIVNSNHVAYSGGPGGINHPPTSQEAAYSRERHTAPTTTQMQHETMAKNNVKSYAGRNGGHPTDLAMAVPETGYGPPLSAGDSPLQLPEYAHFDDGYHCLTFKLEGGKLVNHTLLPYQYHEDRILDFKSFSTSSVVIDRKDYGTYPGTAHYEGRMAEVGFASGTTASGRKWQLSWGPKINELASEDDHAGARPLPAQGTPSVVACNEQSNAPVKQAEQYGVWAIDAKSMKTAVCWLKIAARQGEPMAQGILAAIYYKGVGIPVNLPVAKEYADRAAGQDNYLGDRCLQLMYAGGDGVPKDASKAEYWREKAERDKLSETIAEEHAREVQEQQQAAAERQQQAQGMFLLGVLADLFSAADSDGGLTDAQDAERRREQVNLWTCGDANTPPAVCEHP